ncbi:MAG TPA: hypothetical protein VNN10_08025 [Dehalococcoidia bacterium]|nr:hypothetical protein [Dehalococcoidia bacterium]
MKPTPSRNESGQTTLEFGLILVLVSTALVATLTLLTGGVQDYYGALIDALSAL